MISVQEAKDLIRENATLARTEYRALHLSAGLILAEDIFSRYNIPAFSQSSMDGYAFAFGDLKKYGRLRLSGVSAAGSSESLNLKAGEAIRIFTGAPLPRGADTVVMQEKTTIADGYVLIEDDKLVPGMHMRHPGAEIKKDTLALEKGTQLLPAAMGFLAGIGVDTVSVYPPPSVHIIITGNELQTPGKMLEPGQVYEANSYSLGAALKRWGITEIKISYAGDRLDLVKNAIKDGTENADFVLLTGGVSVGEYDFVLEASSALGIAKIFHKIKQRPGKPLFFGKHKQTLIFGLPGNPASVLTCFYEYVSLALELYMQRNPLLKTINATLAQAVKKPVGLTNFLKASYADGVVSLLDAQESFRMSSYAKANCLIVGEEEKAEYVSGDIVEVHILPD